MRNTSLEFTTTLSVRLVFAILYCKADSQLQSIARVILQSLQFQAQEVSVARLMSQVERTRGSRVCVYQCVCAVTEMKVSVLVCLFSSCNHVTEVREPYGV
jgi:hypothetical protein